MHRSQAQAAAGLRAQNWQFGIQLMNFTRSQTGARTSLRARYSQAVADGVGFQDGCGRVARLDRDLPMR